MTNEEIELLIERHRRKLRLSSFAVPISTGFLSAVFLFISYFFPLADLSILFVVGAVFCGLICGGVSFDELRNGRIASLKEAPAIWRVLGDNHAFGFELSLSTRQLGTEIQNIYNAETSGKLFPLRQSIRLIDTHNRQQQRLKIVEKRLRELRGLQENLSSKMNQLRELGEDYPQGARNLEQINDDLAALGKVHGQIRASCTRLEAIVIGVQKSLQSKQLRRELDQLSARLPQQTGAIEPAFEAESLEDIERQIGREIETYLQLERETDEHLR